VNLQGQNFYKERKQINITKDLQRYDFNLKEQKDLTIKKVGNNPIELEIYSKNYEDIHFCLKWSLSYIFVRSNYSEITKPEELKNWDKCYSTGIHLQNNKSNVFITYQELGIPQESDFINISFYNPNLMEGIKIERIK
jgi:hypothetical protein